MIVMVVDGFDDEELLFYLELVGSELIYDSIEVDEGIEMRDDYQLLSFNVMQVWNFDNFNNNVVVGILDNEYVSDSVQVDFLDNDYGLDG